MITIVPQKPATTVAQPEANKPLENDLMGFGTIQEQEEEHKTDKSGSSLTSFDKEIANQS